jgi:hypothetical protein
LAHYNQASPEEIALRNWKKDWPIYVRVHHAEFVAGTLANGIRLTNLMDQLGSDSFVSTQQNARRGDGNLDPRSACRQKAAMPLTNESDALLGGSVQVVKNKSAFHPCKAHGFVRKIGSYF